MSERTRPSSVRRKKMNKEKEAWLLARQSDLPDSRYGAERFGEPRGWALLWEGEALPGAGGKAAENGDGGQPLRQEERLLSGGLEPRPENGSGPARFADPSGWALGWDGFALVGIAGVAR
jgi:hypothetical protein